jgi:signal transduction histidine kinase
MGYSYDYLGIVYAYKNEFTKAIDYLEKAYKIREQLGEKQSMAVSLVNIGEAYAAMNQFKKAKPYYERSLLLAEEMKFSDLISYNKKMMANCAAGEGDYKAAFDYLNNYIVVNDSLFNLKKNEQLAEIQTKYESEKKAKENIELLQSNNQKELKLAGQRIQIAIMAGILLFGVFGAMLFHNKNKLNQQRILTEEIQKQEKLRLKAMIDSQEAERQRIAAELHDGLGQVLSAARVNLAASNQADEHLKTSLDLIDKSCADLREISHNMMPSLLKKSGLPAALNEIAERINQSGKINVTIDHEENFGRLSPEIEIQIFRITQELLNNILKYAQAKEVQIQLMMEDSIFTMMVEDNGNGFDKEILTSTAGNGWYNIKSRLNLINGDAEIDSRPGSGTVVTIVVPTV